MRQNIILVGAGGHAQSCIDVIEAERKFNIIGLIGAKEQLGQRVMGYPVLGVDQDLPKLIKDCPNALITVGHVSPSGRRKELYDALLNWGFTFPIIVSPLAYVAQSAKIGRGTIVMHHALVNANASLGENCIINTKALIEHDVFVGAHTHISTAAVLNGSVSVAEGSFIGSASVICHGIQIPSGIFLPMGSVIKKEGDIQL